MIIRLYNGAEFIGRFLVDDGYRMLDRVVVYQEKKYLHAPYVCELDLSGSVRGVGRHWIIEQPELIVTDEHRMNTIDGPARPEEGDHGGL